MPLDQILVEDAEPEKSDAVLDQQSGLALVGRDAIAQRLPAVAARDHQGRQGGHGAADRDHRAAAPVGREDRVESRLGLAPFDEGLDQPLLVAAGQDDGAEIGKPAEPVGRLTVREVEGLGRNAEPGEDGAILVRRRGGVGRGRRDDADRGHEMRAEGIEQCGSRAREGAPDEDEARLRGGRRASQEAQSLALQALAMLLGRQLAQGDGEVEIGGGVAAMERRRREGARASAACGEAQRDLGAALRVIGGAGRRRLGAALDGRGHQVLKGIAAEDAPPRPARPRGPEPAAAELGLRFMRLGAAVAEPVGIAGVEVGEAHSGDAVWCCSRVSGVEDDERRFTGDLQPVALDQHRRVLVDAEAEALAGEAKRDEEPADPATAQEMLVHDSQGNRPRPCPRQTPGASGCSARPTVSASIDVPPRMVWRDITAAPALDPATSPPRAARARMASRTGVSAPP